ncbi:unnamed protein product [Miscanthus lutarioriparius]|uniref:Uncharacterized protein n=1 Tax=Miscanthus lutarioriparius TaxID=422564 RepID=A0A811SK31_9POAL|nr:unnamed protein product [Miscanthus lutarioriparius]
MERRGGDADDTVLTFTGLTAVTLTSGVSAYRAAAAGDVGSAAFVGVSYAALLLLFRSLRAYERLPPPRQLAADTDDDDDDGRRLRRRVKREVWTLCTMLTVLFAWKVAAAMPSWPVAAAVWAMAVVTAVGGFLALFCRHP